MEVNQTQVRSCKTVEKIGRPIMFQELVKKQKGGQQLSVLCQLYTQFVDICLLKVIHNYTFWNHHLFPVVCLFFQVESVFLASFIWSKLTTPCCFFLVLDLALIETTRCRKDLQEDRPNIAKGTKDPRVECKSQVLTQTLIEFLLLNLVQASNKHQHLDKT